MNLDLVSILVLAQEPGGLVETGAHGHGPQSLGGVIWKGFWIVFFVLLNAFFVAAEFAIVKVRGSQLAGLAETGSKRAVTAKLVTDHLDAYLSATQLGITLASLALGWLGEPLVAGLVEPALVWAVGGSVSSGVVTTTSVVIGFTVITFLHVVLGELMPKSLAIRRSLGTTLWLSGPLRIFYFAFKLPIFLLNGCANWLLKVLFKIDPVSEGEHLHSAEELKLLVEETEKSQEVTDTEREILMAALELNDLHVRDVLTPRNEVVTLDTGSSFGDNLKVATESGHTRFPLVDGHLDHFVGLIHIKDILRIVATEAPSLEAIKRTLPTVPEMMALDDLLKFFLKEQVHLAVVVDEYGGTLGVVMLDDVIEELVGDIQDEFDEAEEEREFYPVNEDEFEVEGTMPLHELAEYSDLKLDSPDVSTIGGFVTNIVGQLPEVGVVVEIDGFEGEVIETDGKSVGKLRFKRILFPPDEEGEETAEPVADTQ